LLTKATLFLVSVILAAGLAEMTLRLRHYGEANTVHLEKFVEYDSLLGWRHKRSFSSELITNEFHTTLRFNANGLRGKDRPYAKPAGVTRIVVLGDSFVEGYAVNLPDRFSEILEANLGSRFEVIALGVSGYSTDQELLQLEQEGWKYQPDLVLLAFYYNDVWGNGNANPSRPPAVTTHKPVFVMNAGGNLTLTNVPVPYPTPPLRERFKLYSLIRTAVKTTPRLSSMVARAGVAEVGPETRPMGGVGNPDEFEAFRTTDTKRLKSEWTITQALLRRAKQETGQRGVPFVAFYVPTRVEVVPDEWDKQQISPDYGRGQVAARLGNICQAEGIPYIEPSNQFRQAAQQTRLYYKRDVHWNPAGNRLAAQILTGYLRSLAWQQTLGRESH
jgi:hypothetical protein